jgi:hypothetical protein
VKIVQASRNSPLASCAVGGEGERAEGVVLAELPHAGQDLDGSAVEQRERQHHEFQGMVADDVGIEHAQHERSHSERGQAERPGIGDSGGTRGFGLGRGHFRSDRSGHD